MLGVAERNALHYYYNDGGSMYLARVQAMHLLVMLVRASMKRKLGMTIKMPLMLCKDVLMQWGRYLMLMIPLMWRTPMRTWIQICQLFIMARMTM